MKLFNKKQFNEQFGKSKWYHSSIDVSCIYLAGDEMPEMIGKRLITDFKIHHKQGLRVAIVTGVLLGRQYFLLKNTEIKNIHLQIGGILDTQSRSTIGRAAVGGLLLGPAGAVIGGMTGMKDKTIKDIDQLIITVNIEDKELTLLFEIVKGKTTEVTQFFRHNYPRIFSAN